ncbi:MAG: ATP-binding protein [Treponema sp.]|nr:ATP-binding protein [Treponema sp.]MBQ7167748.1 ATP-binding protein [Treponema sp.]
MQYIARKLDLTKLLSSKSLFLFGPRQTGKSSFIKNQVAREDIALFWTLLDGRLRLKVIADPGLLRQEVEQRKLHDCVIVIDEIQKCPELLDEVHFLIEERGIRFLLTGSSARKLKDTGVNLLGGRAWQRHFHPLCFPEVGGSEDYTLPFIFEHGLLPSMFLSQDVEEDLAAYVDSYLTEEIAAEGAARNIPAFARFLNTAALTNAQLVNYTNIANDAQLPVQTVRQWYDVLTDTLLGYQVGPFSKTEKRKAVSSSKFYFFDIAIARALRNIPAPALGTAEAGEYFEQLVCMELTAWIDYERPRSKLTFWRSKSGLEVDFCVDTVLAVEVKLSSSISDKQLKGLRALREEGIFRHYVVVCQEEHPRAVDGMEILPWKYFFERLWAGDYLS